jgi:NitT/TauT family transport system permease protein
MNDERMTAAASRSGAYQVRKPRGAFAKRLLPLVPGIVALLVWQFSSGYLIPAAYVSTPIDVSRRLIEIFFNGTILPDLYTTLTEFALGFVLGSLTGCVVGYALGRSTLAARLFEPYIMAAYGVPMITLAPLFIIWFGIGIWSKVMISAIMVFFMVFFNVYMGVRSIDVEFVQVARVLGANESQLTKHVYLQSAMPFVFMGLHAGVPYGVIGVIVGEFISAFQGLGLYMDKASTTFDPAGVFAGIVILLACIVIVRSLIGLAERRLLRWNASLRSRN